MSHRVEAILALIVYVTGLALAVFTVGYVRNNWKASALVFLVAVFRDVGGMLRYKVAAADRE